MQHYFHFVLLDPTLIHYSHFFYTWWWFRFTTHTPGIPCLLRSSVLFILFPQTVMALSMSLVIQKTKSLGRDPPVQVLGPPSLCGGTASPLFHWDAMCRSHKRLGELELQIGERPPGRHSALVPHVAGYSECHHTHTHFWLRVGLGMGQFPSPSVHSL